MRAMMVLLALAGLAGCDQAERKPPAIEAKPVVIAYDGAVTKDPAALIKHGERMAAMLGCTGCHGKNLQGQNVTDGDPNFGDMNASNVTLALASYDDAALDKLIRHGVPKDGREFWFMAAESHQFVGDQD
ncbi:MAG: hypothetical protein LH610_06470, partial [Sphingomonas bacterium]|nr:hypothetical protein [Sphingomonas bacterium]